MNVDVSNILKSIGPAASIIFAAWIFMGFLQQRYDAAIDRYREIVAQYRHPDIGRVRRANIRDEIYTYKRRCELMTTATMVGLIAAILLILTLVAGELDILFPTFVPLKYISAGSALLGFLLVIAAAVLVMVEAALTYRQIATEVLDVEDLADSTGQRSGAVTEVRGHG